MKILTKSIQMLCVIVIVCSCDETSDNDVASEPILTTIVESFSIDDTSVSSMTTYTINDGLNTQIELEGGAYQIQSFEDGKMVLIEYFSSDNVLTGTEEMSYDSDDRLISVLKSYPLQNYMSSRTYNYEDNEILVLQVDSETNGTPISESNFKFVLDSQNRMVHFENENNSISWDAEYSGGNLSNYKYYAQNELKGEALFTYSQDLASEPYQKERFRYGTEWRNNIMLSQTGAYAFKQLAELGENYLTGYTYTLTSDPSSTISLNVIYEFDESGKLRKQTKQKQFFLSYHERILIYNYQ